MEGSSSAPSLQQVPPDYAPFLPRSQSMLMCGEGEDDCGEAPPSEGPRLTPSPNGAGSSSSREMRVLVLGDQGVGKTALVVRYLTGRFIGDYAKTDSVCSYVTTLEGKGFRVYIADTSGDMDIHASPRLEERLAWAEGLLLVFSVTSRRSFVQLQQLVDDLQLASLSLPTRPPCVLVASKCDLGRYRQVPDSESRRLASRLRCPYVETSASENRGSAVLAFVTLLREMRLTQQRCSKGVKRRNASATLLHLRNTLRSLADDFRQRSTTF